MRTPSCPDQPRAPERPLAAVARAIDEAATGTAEHLAFHAVLAGDGFDLGIRAFPTDVHPFAELAGLVAPADWDVFGLQVQGTAHHLDDGQRARTTTTYAVDRGGHEHTILRQGEHRRELPGGAVGTLPDLCRRVLGLPTPPPPAPTIVAFTTAWLDAVLAAWNDPSQRRHLCASFAAVAAVHPAVGRGDAPADPRVLARIARAHAEAWPWARLRAEPEGLALPHGALPAATASWMDDGAYARWVLGAFPGLAALALDVVELLGPVTGAEVAAHLHAVLRG